MYVLVFYDGINISFSNMSIDNEGQSSIVKVSKSIEKLKKYVKKQYDTENSGQLTIWEYDKEFDRWIGLTFYDEEMEPNQYFVIVRAEELI